MNQDQITSLARSVLKIAGSALVAHGLTAAATIVNGEDFTGVVLAIVGLVWSHYSHNHPSTTDATTPSKP